ncbi:MAG: hypothetical protein LBD59_09560 [Prevotellaceae bacterium]|jgi:hypothetical protein|nr:hypothetical protein [Prevotellaceae bacterium]
MKSEKNSKKFDCKIEELTVICSYGLSLGRRDLADFTAFSPMFNEEYFNGFETMINAAEDLVSPQTETKELKKITKQLYETLDGLADPLNKLRGYLHLAGTSIGISDKDFGISLLTKKIHSRDAEGVRHNLMLVNTNIRTFMSELKVVGLNDEIINHLSTAVTPITQYNLQQFEIFGKRRGIVYENMGKLNELYAQLMEFLKTGNIIYKGSNPIKAGEYSFINLKKKVRTIPLTTPTSETK